MKAILSSIEVNQTSETAGDPPATYRTHVSIYISRGRRYRNGKNGEQVSTLFPSIFKKHIFKKLYLRHCLFERLLRRTCEYLYSKLLMGRTRLHTWGSSLEQP